MKPTLNEKFLAYLALFSGISISIVAEYYSILGLTAIFAAAVVPVIIMGIALGVGKITATLWLKQNWSIAPWTIRLYLLSAVTVLMFITSMGIFGFLSKAHSDQSLVSGDVQAKIALYDEKIKIERETIDANRKALKQLDEAVDQVMVRSTDEKGADKAVAIRRSQQRDRAQLLGEITKSQQRITALNEQRAPIAAEVRKVEAEVGPIKYIAALVYEDNPDSNVLEKAVRWVIIMIVIVFDPLAVILLLASQISFQNFRERNQEEPTPVYTYETFEKPTEEDKMPDYEQDDGPLTEEQIKQVKESVEKPWNEKYPYLDKPFVHFKDLEPMVYQRNKKKNVEVDTTSTIPDLERPGDYLTPAEDKLFVQNEEQQESNLWTNTVAITHDDYIKASQDKKQEYLEQVIPLVRSKRLSLSDIPESMQSAVKSKI